MLILKGYQLKREEISISQEAQRLMQLLQKDLPTKQAAAIVAEFMGLRKRDLYQWAISH